MRRPDHRRHEGRDESERRAAPVARSGCLPRRSSRRKSTSARPRRRRRAGVHREDGQAAPRLDRPVRGRRPRGPRATSTTRSWCSSATCRRQLGEPRSTRRSPRRSPRPAPPAGRHGQGDGRAEAAPCRAGRHGTGVATPEGTAGLSHGRRTGRPPLAAVTPLRHAAAWPLPTPLRPSGPDPTPAAVDTLRRRPARRGPLDPERRRSRGRRCTPPRFRGATTALPAAALPRRRSQPRPPRHRVLLRARLIGPSDPALCSGSLRKVAQCPPVRRQRKGLRQRVKGHRNRGAQPPRDCRRHARLRLGAGRMLVERGAAAGGRQR